MEEVLNQVKKHLRNGKIALTVIVLAFAIGEFFLYDYILQELGGLTPIIIIIVLPFVAASVGIGILIKLVIKAKVKQRYYSLSRYNDSKAVEERKTFVYESDRLFLNAESQSKKFIALFIIIGIAVFVLICFAVAEWNLPNWAISIFCDIESIIGMIIGYQSINCSVKIHNNEDCYHKYGESEKLIVYCPKCYCFNSLQASRSLLEKHKMDKEYKWEDHYGTTAEIYSGSEKVGSVYGRTGSTMYSRQPIATWYLKELKCKYCDYQKEFRDVDVDLGDWS